MLTVQCLITFIKRPFMSIDKTRFKKSLFAGYKLIIPNEIKYLKSSRYFSLCPRGHEKRTFFVPSRARSTPHSLCPRGQGTKVLNIYINHEPCSKRVHRRFDCSYTTARFALGYGRIFASKKRRPSATLRSVLNILNFVILVFYNDINFRRKKTPVGASVFCDQNYRSNCDLYAIRF